MLPLLGFVVIHWGDREKQKVILQSSKRNAKLRCFSKFKLVFDLIWLPNFNLYYPWFALLFLILKLIILLLHSTIETVYIDSRSISVAIAQEMALQVTKFAFDDTINITTSNYRVIIVLWVDRRWHVFFKILLNSCTSWVSQLKSHIGYFRFRSKKLLLSKFRFFRSVWLKCYLRQKLQHRLHDFDPYFIFYLQLN